jgi:hypothetical protein
LGLSGFAYSGDGHKAWIDGEGPFVSADTPISFHFIRHLKQNIGIKSFFKSLELLLSFNFVK